MVTGRTKGSSWTVAPFASPSSKYPSRSRRGVSHTGREVRGTTWGDGRLRRWKEEDQTPRYLVFATGLLNGISSSPFDQRTVENVQTRRARLVASSSPTRRRGSTLNLAP